MYETIRTTTMMTRKIGRTPPPIQSKMSGTVALLLDGFNDEPVAGDADHPGGRPDRDLGRGGGAVLVRLALLLDEHRAVAPGRDPDRHERRVADEVRHGEGFLGLGLPEDGEEHPGDAHPDQSEGRADDG